MVQRRLPGRHRACCAAQDSVTVLWWIPGTPPWHDVSAHPQPPSQSTHQTQGSQDEPVSDPYAALQTPDAEALKAASSFAQPTCSSTYA